MSEDKRATKKRKISSNGGYDDSLIGADAGMALSLGDKADRDSLAAERKALEAKEMAIRAREKAIATREEAMTARERVVVSRERTIETREASVQAVAGTNEARENAVKHDRAALEARNEAIFEAAKKAVEDDRATLETEKGVIYAQAMDAAKKAVEVDRAALEAEKEAMKSRDTSAADIITLKVGEREFEVLRETLCLVEGSLLAIQFSGRKMGGEYEEDIRWTCVP